jgi:hypothetical protein
MANVPVNISRTIVQRPNGSASNAPVFDFPVDPLNPPGGGGAGSQIPPVHLSYTSEANMIAGQANQIANFIYFDGSFYWEYLGTTNGTIADYRDISGNTSIDHNSLTGLQGGTTNEYYHLTETQYDAVIAANSPATGNPFATLADLGALGGGTVTSVSLTMPAIFSVANSPVTTAGTLAVTFVNQSAFTVFARESGTGTPSFQSLLEGHLPNNISFTKLQDVTGNTILGKIGSSGKIQELSATDVRTLLNVANGADAYVSWVLAVTGTAGSQTVTSGSTVTITGTAPITAVRSGATVTLSHAVSGVTAGTYNNVTVNTLGHVTAGSNVGYITGNQTITLSGDVTGSGATSITATIANQAVTYAKIQNVTADRLLGRITTTGTAQELTATQVRTLLNVADGATANVGTVTSIATNNGVTGGTITGTGTIGLTGQALALHNLATNGLIARTGSGTVAGRTITGSTSISVTNGNGVSGNPTLSAIFGTTAGTVAEGSSLGNYVLKAGDTMTGDLSFDSSLNRSVIFNLGAQIRAAGAAFVISSGTGTSNNILLRPNGDSSTTGQMRVNSDGTVEIGSQATATNHAVLGARTITAGTGLTGGGNLTADRTLNVSFGTTAGTAAQGNDSRFHNPVTIGTANGLSLSTQVLSLALASGSTTGALSSANWTTFNNKVGGSGVNGRVSFWDGTNSQSSDSLFTWDNTGKILSVGNQSGLRGATAAFVISANTSSSNRILLRPNGDTSTTNQFDINTDFIRYNGDFLINTAGLSEGGKLQVNGAINTNSTILTADPDAGARHPWKLGRASTLMDNPPEAQLVIKVEINGVKYALLALLDT